MSVFANAEASVAATWHAIMDHAIKNRLTYSAVDSLLEFVFPIANQLPTSLHAFKKQYCPEAPMKQTFCSECLEIIPF